MRDESKVLMSFCLVDLNMVVFLVTPEFGL